MTSQFWGPWTVILAFTLAGGLIGGDIALWQPNEHVSFLIPVASGVLTGFLVGALIAWFVGQTEHMN